MKKNAGLLILVAVVLVVSGVMFMKAKRSSSGSGTASGDVVTLKGWVGGEKLNLLQDPDVIRILADKYKLALNIDRRGSIEMVTDPKGQSEDFLWPSSQVALEMYRSDNKPMKAADTIFNSPLVLYSWGQVTDALVKAGIAQKDGGTYSVTDLPKLLNLVAGGRDWKELGLTQLYGKVTIFSTDPTHSNSGNMFAGLLANMENGGKVVAADSVPNVMPKVKKFFDDQGFMEQSSDVIFRQFLTRGMGDKPIIIGYEAQLLEYLAEHGAELQGRTEPVRMLYPKPTVWSSHPLIALTDAAKPLIQAMQDAEIQKIAWERHGFRSATGENAPIKLFDGYGVPKTIQDVIPMPSSEAMRAILEGLGMAKP